MLVYLWFQACCKFHDNIHKSKFHSKINTEDSHSHQIKQCSQHCATCLKHQFCAWECPQYLLLCIKTLVSRQAKSSYFENIWTKCQMAKTVTFPVCLYVHTEVCRYVYTYMAYQNILYMYRHVVCNMINCYTYVLYVV